MKGDMMIWNYFRKSDSALRRFVESIEIGETLLGREIMERTGLCSSDAWRVLRLLEGLGMVERMPFVWPEKPPNFDFLSKRGRARWRKSIRGSGRGVPGARYKFLGFTVSPVDDVLRLAMMDKQGEIGESEG